MSTKFYPSARIKCNEIINPYTGNSVTCTNDAVSLYGI